MDRRVLLLLGLWATACAACRGGGIDATGTAPAGQVEHVRVEPMVFVMLYRAELEQILNRHLGDCDDALTELLRFVADHRQAFHDATKDKEASWQPTGPESQNPVQLLMQFGNDCPAQMARLNQAVHAVSR